MSTFAMLLTTSLLIGGNVSSIVFDENQINVSFKNNTIQKIKAEIYPDEIDYNYYSYDINFDGNKDLLVYESGIGQRAGHIYVYLYNIELDKFNAKPYSIIESFRINQDKSSICLLSNDSVEFINAKNKVKYFMDNDLFYIYDGKTQDINKHQYENEIFDCSQFEDIVPSD